jgi:iron complex outermembrane recepter protein
MKMLGPARLRRGVAVLFMMTLCVTTLVARAQAPTKDFNVPAQSATTGIPQFARQAGIQILVAESLVRGKKVAAVTGSHSIVDALSILLQGTGLSATSEDGVTYTVAARVSTVGDPPTSEASFPPTGQKGSSGGILLAQAGQSSPGPETLSSDQKSDEEKKAPLEEVVVTGTHIRGTENIGTPTLTITRQDINDTGYETLQQLVSTLPQNFNGFTMLGSYATGGVGIQNTNENNATAIDLRGLGPQSTLTLIDGQRAAGSVEGRVVDVSMIPLSMVDHVDIETGGASAIYGADAVGGVVNIVLRHAYEGADTEAYYGGTAAGGNRLQVSQTFGLDRDRYGFIVGYEFAHDEEFDIMRTNLVQSLTSVGSVPAALPGSPDDWRHSVYASGHFDVNDDLKLFANGSYVHKTQQSYTALSYPTAGVDLTTLDQQETSEYGTSVGALIGLVKSWQLNVTGSFSTNENSQDDFSSITFPGMTYNTPASVDSRSSLTSVSAVADGQVAEVGGVKIKGAIGLEQREEKLSLNPEPPGGIGTIPSSERKVHSAFAEVDVPIVQQGEYAGLRRLEFNAAARDDDYSDFGNSLDPQFGIAWDPVDNLTFRGAYAHAFRAPDLYTLDRGAQSQISDFIIATPANPTGAAVPALNLGGGNANLEPEKAKTWSTGLDYVIPWIPATRLSLSYFDINYDDRIYPPLGTSPSIIDSALYPTSVVNLHPTPAQLQYYYDLAQYQGNVSASQWDGNIQNLLTQIPSIAIIDDRYQNIAIERLRGVDFLADSRVQTPIGTAITGIDLTRTLTHYQQLTPQSAPVTLFNQVGEPVGFKARIKAGLTEGAYSGILFLNYINSYTNQFATPTSQIASWTTVDMTLRWDCSESTCVGPVHGFSVTFSVQNLLGRNPPQFQQNPSGLLFDPANANPFGRFLSLNIAKKW